MRNKDIGAFGENVAIKYLCKKGYKILDRNYTKRMAHGPAQAEIDIVAKKDGIIYFFEVKTSILNKNSISIFRPENRVNMVKYKKIAKAARNWLAVKNISLDIPWQIAVLAILVDIETKKAKVYSFLNVLL